MHVCERLHEHMTAHASNLHSDDNLLPSSHCATIATNLIIKISRP